MHDFLTRSLGSRQRLVSRSIVQPKLFSPALYARPFSMAKRKRSAAAAAAAAAQAHTDLQNGIAPPLGLENVVKGRASRRGMDKSAEDPALNQDVMDAQEAVRASADEAEHDVDVLPAKKKKAAKKATGVVAAPKNGKTKPAKSVKGCKKSPSAVKTEESPKDLPRSDAAIPADDQDPEDTSLPPPDDPAEVTRALTRPPPINSSYLPLPWRGRLGYACLNTYLRNATPPVFCSRTTRIASIIEHRHPLRDPTQPEHPTKNRPDREQPADPALGQRFVENLCLANVRDMGKLLRWNDRYNIKFLRLSSEAFPFASHAEYGYKLAPFAASELAKVGKIVAELGHRVTTHPGQFTQLGSPRKEVIDASVRDLHYHDEMLSLLKLPPQQDRDAVMILHLGGVFGDKEATLQRFRENYITRLSDSIKRRLVLENDDVSWSVHDLLPICRELNIPFVLDFHHHNIVHSEQIREGTQEIMSLYPEIRETWKRKGITMKMHYSEPTPAAITAKQRRKHSPRVATMPSCPDDVDLMIEAKDKEQAVLELMRTFKLPGFDTFNNIIPHSRGDDESIMKVAKGQDAPDPINEQEHSMGGPDGRVYWPPGMEEWLLPKKREVRKKAETDGETPAKSKAASAKEKAEKAAQVKAERGAGKAETKGKDNSAKKVKAASKKKVKREATPEETEEEEPEQEMVNGVKEEEPDEDISPPKRTSAKGNSRPSTGRTTSRGKGNARKSARTSNGSAKKNYKESDDSEDLGEE